MDPLSGILAIISLAITYIQEQNGREQSNDQQLIDDYKEWCRRNDHNQLIEKIDENKELIQSILTDLNNDIGELKSVVASLKEITQIQEKLSKLSSNNENALEALQVSIDKSIELQRKVRDFTIVIELDNNYHADTLEDFMFLMKVSCTHSAQNPASFIASVLYSRENNLQKVVNGKVVSEIISPILGSWSDNPEKLLSKVCYGARVDHRFFKASVHAYDHEAIDRVIDIEDKDFKFYGTENIINKIKNIHFFINDLLIESTNISKLDRFPATSLITAVNIKIPEQLSQRLPQQLIETPLLRLGKKGGDKRTVAMGFPDIEATWRINFNQEIRRINLREI
tara:strand:- start:42 stop:1061 length:1020 start_codon:yes stop_codon:yes gene_type:complete